RRGFLFGGPDPEPGLERLPGLGDARPLERREELQAGPPPERGLRAAERRERLAAAELVALGEQHVREVSRARPGEQLLVARADAAPRVHDHEQPPPPLPPPPP